MIEKIKFNLKRLFYKGYDDDVRAIRKIERRGRLLMARKFDECLSEVLNKEYGSD